MSWFIKNSLQLTVWTRNKKFIELLATWSLGYLQLFLWLDVTDSRKNPHSQRDCHFLSGHPYVTADIFEYINFKLLLTLVKIALFFCKIWPTSHIFSRHLSTFNDTVSVPFPASLEVEFLHKLHQTRTDTRICWPASMWFWPQLRRVSRIKSIFLFKNVRHLRSRGIF